MGCKYTRKSTSLSSLKIMKKSPITEYSDTKHTKHDIILSISDKLRVSYPRILCYYPVHTCALFPCLVHFKILTPVDMYCPYPPDDQIGIFATALFTLVPSACLVKVSFAACRPPQQHLQSIDDRCGKKFW